MLAALVMTPDAWSQTPQLHLVSTAWPPFTNSPGQPGFALDLVNDALKRIGTSADTTIVDDSSFTTALLSGKYDGSAAAWKDAEREKVLVFSEPYLENRLILVGRRGSDVSAPKLSSLAGKRIVLVGGYSYGDAVPLAPAPFSHAAGRQPQQTLANDATTRWTSSSSYISELQRAGENASGRRSTPLIVEPFTWPSAARVRRRCAHTGSTRNWRGRDYNHRPALDWIRPTSTGRRRAVPRTDRRPNPPARSHDLFAATPPEVEVTRRRNETVFLCSGCITRTAGAAELQAV